MSFEGGALVCALAVQGRSPRDRKVSRNWLGFLNPSPIDARLAAAAVELVREEGQALERAIPYRLIYSCHPAAIATRSLRRIEGDTR